MAGLVIRAQFVDHTVPSAPWIPSLGYGGANQRGVRLSELNANGYNHWPPELDIPTPSTLVPQSGQQPLAIRLLRTQKPWRSMSRALHA